MKNVVVGFDALGIPAIAFGFYICLFVHTGVPAGNWIVGGGVVLLGAFLIFLAVAGASMRLVWKPSQPGASDENSDPPAN